MHWKHWNGVEMNKQGKWNNSFKNCVAPFSDNLIDRIFFTQDFSILIYSKSSELTRTSVLMNTE